MKLVSATQGQVVRNTNNGSHYRHDRIEKGKVRIWPLELFPTGLLIPKPTPTLVDPDIDVQVIGPWHDPMMVEGRPKHSRAVYERELAQKLADLSFLEAAYERLPTSGTGKQSRGSWANKLKNVRSRIETLQRGLGFEGEGVKREVARIESAMAALQVMGLVQLPSGRPAKIVSMTGLTARVVVMSNGAPIEAPLPCSVLRPWSDSRVCTL